LDAFRLVAVAHAAQFLRAMENREQYFKVVRRCALAIALGLIALGLFLARGLIADQFATSYGLTIGLTIQDRAYRPRLERALAALTVPDDVNATYAFDRNSWSRSQIELSAPTREKAVAAARVVGDTVAQAYDSAGETKLDVRVPSRAYPVDNPTSTTVLNALTFGAPLLELLAIGLFVATWLRGRANGAITAVKGMGIAIALSLGVPLATLMLPGWLFMSLFAMVIPVSIAVAIVVKMGEVRRASRWPSAPGRIVRAQTRKVQTKQSGGASSIGNVPDVEYVYTVDGVEHHGKRISIGEFKPDSPEVEAALERYQIGRTGPVFYNPDKPDEAVLERDPPARPAVMYGFAGGVILIGLVVVFGFTRAHDIIQWLQPHFPPGAIVHGFLFFVAAGLIASLVVISDLAETRAAMRWPTVAGTVLSSRAESRRELTHTGGGTTATVWSPLVEYSYRVGARSYHGARIAFGPEVAAGRDLAEAVVARYPAGAAVTVHYDPTNPAHATLETNLAHRWVALVIPLAFFAIALFFSGRLHL
jgi:hypothetical protein